MRRVWCCLFGCASVFARWFRWPYYLCWKAADDWAWKDDMPTFKPTESELTYIVDDDNRVAYSRYEWGR